MQIEDGWLDIASGAATSTAIEPNTDFVPQKSHDSKVPDSSPDSEPPAPALIESDWAPIMEFTAADVFQHSPFGDILSSLKYLSLSGEPCRTAVRTVEMWTMKKFNAHPPPT